MESPQPEVRDYILIEDIAPSDRPREKAMRDGIGSLSTPELVAIIFGNGMRGKSVLTMSQELLRRYGGRLSDIASRSVRDIVRDNPGVGPAKAIGLLAAFELGMRCRDEDVEIKPVIKGSDSVYALMRRRLQHIHHEEFWVLMLSRGNTVVDRLQISSGGTAATVVDPKIIFKRVMERGDEVASIILVHNHPSGNLRPSIEDDRLTSRLVEGGKLLDITVFDHVIITPNGYFSYADEGKMRN
ncbi:DNA repair protein RadC [uncultured Muribaculum sp.]|uniref:RadC family protein n=1 Tax=uncultured Muribaculum sp. TaxID=1918613 RepID=UPI0025D23840|nr:DNA repair protein RadC [uncultured Muribaculum sp.]